MGMFSRFVASKAGTIVGAAIAVGATVPATIAVHDATTGKTTQQTTFVDISSNNRAGDVAKYAPGRTIEAGKANEGTGYVWAGGQVAADQAHAAGLAFWHYDFARPDFADPTAECGTFLGAVRGHWRPGDRAVLDYEIAGSRSDAQLAYWANTWRTCVGKSLGSSVVVVYTGPWFVNPRPQLAASLCGVDIWIAAYQSTEPNVPCFHIIAWQFTDRGHVDGYPDPLDVSVDLTTPVEAPDAGQPTPSANDPKATHPSDLHCAKGLVVWLHHGCYRLVRIPAQATGVYGYAYWTHHGWRNLHKLPAKAQGVLHYRHTAKGWVHA